MDAQPELALLTRLLAELGLEAILIGNMAASLHGAPVSTLGIAFFFWKTPHNLQRLQALADALGAMVVAPYYVTSGLFRLQRSTDALQLNFLAYTYGLSGWETLRTRSDLLMIL